MPPAKVFKRWGVHPGRELKPKTGEIREFLVDQDVC